MKFVCSLLFVLASQVDKPSATNVTSTTPKTQQSDSLAPCGQSHPIQLTTTPVSFTSKIGPRLGGCYYDFESDRSTPFILFDKIVRLATGIKVDMYQSVHQTEIGSCLASTDISTPCSPRQSTTNIARIVIFNVNSQLFGQPAARFVVSASNLQENGFFNCACPPSMNGNTIMLSNADTTTRLTSSNFNDNDINAVPCYGQTCGVVLITSAPNIISFGSQQQGSRIDNGYGTIAIKQFNRIHNQTALSICGITDQCAQLTPPTLPYYTLVSEVLIQTKIGDISEVSAAVNYAKPRRFTLDVKAAPYTCGDEAQAIDVVDGRVEYYTIRTFENLHCSLLVTHNTNDDNKQLHLLVSHDYPCAFGSDIMSISVYDGQGSDGRLIGRFSCNNLPPVPTVSTTGSFYIVTSVRNGRLLSNQIAVVLKFTTFDPQHSTTPMSTTTKANNSSKLYTFHSVLFFCIFTLAMILK